MKIGDIMTKKVRTLSPEMPVKDAIGALLVQKISGLPVVDASGKIIGMFTEKDVLRNVLPSYISQVGKFVYENTPKTVTSKVAKLDEYKVADLMRHEVVTVTQDTPVSEVAHIMLTQNVRRIPIVDQDGTMVGIAARSDVLENILKG